ncbi:MAG: S9 family peptidase [Phyllobacteriaceae bacterium]|nr:S9 family peptidase [Phyllobacteriaceae bacterium]
MRSLPPAPRPQSLPVSDTRHGITRTDEYAWLRAANWQAVFKDPSVLDPTIKAHLDAENAYANAWLAPLADLRATLVKEMRGRIKEDDESIPVPDGPFAYGSSFVEGGQQPRFYRVPRNQLDAPRDILLDGDKEAAGKPFFSIGTADASHDHRHLLWSYDDNGSEYYTLLVRDLATGIDLDDRLADTGGSAVWSADNTALVYVNVNENHRPSKIYVHRIGTEQADDTLIFEEPDTGFFVDVSGSRLNDLMFISVGDHDSSEVRLLDAANPLAAPRLVEPRQPEVQYGLEEGGDEFFILTNADGAKDFKIMTAPVASPGKAHWQQIVPHEPGRLIISMQSYARHIAWIERRDGLPRIVIRNRADGAEHAIAFAEEAYSLGLQGAAEYDTDVIRFTYSSMTTPNQLFDYNMATRERTLLKTQSVPSGHNAEDYVTRRIMAPAHDGQSVPISLLYRKDTPLDGTAPCLLYGYGAYGITIPASFSTNTLSLVDRGFVYAIAHVRGGKDKGYQWYENGKKADKANTFHDFIAAGEHLVASGFTAQGRIIAEGRSAGGLLMGAVANMAPTLFGGIIAGVPFVDALNTMLDDTLPLTPPEWTEWGNPIESAEEYQWIAAYSPYDNVAALPYPAILALAGLTDPRVTYWEPAKWVARLRDHSTSGQAILFDINIDAGHGGSSGRFARLEELAKAYAFAIDVAASAAHKPIAANAEPAEA